MLRYKSGRHRSESNHSRFHRDRVRYILNRKRKKKNSTLFVYIYISYIYAIIPYDFSVFVGKIEQTRHAITFERIYISLIIIRIIINGKIFSSRPPFSSTRTNQILLASTSRFPVIDIRSLFSSALVIFTFT